MPRPGRFWRRRTEATARWGSFRVGSRPFPVRFDSPRNAGVLALHGISGNVAALRQKPGVAADVFGCGLGGWSDPRAREGAEF